MTKKDKEIIYRFLRSIKKRELSVNDMKNALERMEERFKTPPSWTSNIESLGGGGFTNSKIDKWIEFLDTFETRKSFYQDEIFESTRKINLYYKTLDDLAECEPHFGTLGVEIIRLKFYYCLADETIYTDKLFCSRMTYYRTLRKTLEFFADVLLPVLKIEYSK